MNDDDVRAVRPFRVKLIMLLEAQIVAMNRQADALEAIAKAFNFDD